MQIIQDNTQQSHQVQKWTCNMQSHESSTAEQIGCADSSWNLVSSTCQLRQRLCSLRRELCCLRRANCMLGTRLIFRRHNSIYEIRLILRRGLPAWLMLKCSTARKC